MTITGTGEVRFLQAADPAYQHTVLYRRQSETRCGKARPDRRGMAPPAITQLPKCPVCYPLQAVGKAL
jgi:hypothetical protein